MSEKIKAVRAGIIAPSEGGKSYLGSGFTIGQWVFHRRESIVYDPWCKKKKHPWSEKTDWGPGAWVTDNFERWIRAVNGTEGKCCVWDETTTSGGSSKKNVGLFTEIRHNHPVLIAMGHRFPSLHPTMRGCLTHLFLGRSMQDDADAAAGEMTDTGLKIAAGLGQYEFALKRPWRDVERVRYSPAQIKAGLRF